jgi:hypothetical protein
MALRAFYIFLLALAAGPTYADITGRVVGVTDGDTIKVLETRTMSSIKCA